MDAKDEKAARRSSESGTAVDHAERASSSQPPAAAQAPPAGMDKAETERLEQNTKMANPLAGLGAKQLADMGESFCRDAGITDDEDLRAFRLGAMIAGNQNKYDTITELTEREREVLDREVTHKWSNPAHLYWVIASKSRRAGPLSVCVRSPGVLTTSLPLQSAPSVRPSRVWTRPS